MSQIFASVNSDYRNHQNLVTLPKIYLGTIWFTSACSSNLTSPWQLRFDKQFFRILKFSLFHWNWSIFGHFGAFRRSQMAVVWEQLTSNSYVVWRYQHMLRQNKHFWRAICPLGVTEGGGSTVCAFSDKIEKSGRIIKQADDQWKADRETYQIPPCLIIEFFLW